MSGSEMTFFFLVMCIAFLYSSVGHGGASGYLALLSVYSFSPEIIRPSALLLNILVSLIASILYIRKGHFKWELFWPFALGSIPASYVGSLMVIDTLLYKRILGVLLLFPVFRLLMMSNPSEESFKKQHTLFSLLIGMAIGLFSGMIGIGGGIILSPVILLMHWANMKQTAAVSAVFILVNSLAGLAGLWQKGFSVTPDMVSMILVAFVGGLAGSYFGAKKFNGLLLRRILAVVLFMASIKLLLT